jgi:hypothetical protein
MKERLKQGLAWTLVIAIVVGSICSLGFTTCRVHGKRAVVAKWFRTESLKVGDMLLIEPDMVASTQLVPSRIEQIIPPDESKRMKASGRHRAIAQSILDMDLKPTYSVKIISQETNDTALIIHEHQIKGKIITVFGGAT